MCHHKASSAALARLLKTALRQRLTGGEVFLDSDNLLDLSRRRDVYATNRFGSSVCRI